MDNLVKTRGFNEFYSAYSVYVLGVYVIVTEMGECLGGTNRRFDTES